MLEPVVCPVLVRRDEELAVLEDALLAAHRGESRFVLLAGDAGMGKTRLTTELAGSARKLGCAVLWGSCSEAELALPYLPFVEAIGNHLAAVDVAHLGARLGPARKELAQLFPQLSDGSPPEPGHDPAQAKLRLFEAVVSLLAEISRDRSLLLVVDDVHWADASTRELLDHLARRLSALPTLVVATYRDDELHRRHPLTPVLQSWRRSGLAETVKLEPLPPVGVAEMIRAMFVGSEVEGEFTDIMYARSEGNPFVLEEMLKEAIERGDLFRTASGWDRKALGDLTIPDTVRDTILVRLERLDPETVTTLQAAAALGRMFDSETLIAVSGVGEEAVFRGLEAAIGQQLIEERAEATGIWRWRHALTQEAIYGDMVTPRRQQLHSRAADAIAAQSSPPSVELAYHLLGAARFSEAVPACLAAAADAEQALAFSEAASLLERALPHVSDALARARVVCAIGRLSWFNGAPAAAAKFLLEGIGGLEAAGERVEAARYRVILGRCHWELLRSDLAGAEFEAARRELEAAGPSADLATAYLRISGLRTFNSDYAGGIEAARGAIEVSEAVGADFERVWARSFLALGLMGNDVSEGLRVAEETYQEAVAKQYWLIAANVAYNDIWCRVHFMQPELEERLRRLGELPVVPAAVWSLKLSEGYVARATGRLADALEGARSALATFEQVRQGKMLWRSKVSLAEILVELNRLDEACAALPDASERSDIQDVVYDSEAQIRVRLARGEIEDAAARAEEIQAGIDYLRLFRGTLEVAAEALIAAGRVGEARALVEEGRRDPSAAGTPLLDEAEARVLLAEGQPDRAVPLARSAARGAYDLGFNLAGWRSSVVLADALGRTGERDQAAAILAKAVAAAEGAGALRIAGDGRKLAQELGFALPEPSFPPDVGERQTEPVPLGERLVTSLFADVRGYTTLTAETSPQELDAQMTALYRFARTEVERHYGIVDKFAGDAIMATFNVAGDRVDHCVQALEAALALRDKASLLDLRLGIGIAVGSAVLGQGASDANIAVRGVATNLAARLQAAAAGGEILLSDEAHRRVESWLEERRLEAARDSAELKGFAGEQVVFRIPAPSVAPA